jgi:hypothetical protein
LPEQSPPPELRDWFRVSPTVQEDRGVGIIGKQDAYVPSELEDAFDAAWLELARQNTPVLRSQQTKLRLALARCLVNLSEAGVVDRDELQRRAIELALASED